MNEHAKWTLNADGTYSLRIDIPSAHNQGEYLECRTMENTASEFATKIQMYFMKRIHAKDNLSLRQFASAVIERMLVRRKIEIKSIPPLLYKRFTIENYDPLKDKTLTYEQLPEIYLQIDDLQPKHLTKQGSYYFIQNAWMQRLISSLDIEHDLLSQTLLFDSKTWFSGSTRDMKQHSFSLNIHHNRISNGRRGKYAHSREEWIISISRYEEFKRFMKTLKETVDTTEYEDREMSHQACYLLQLFADRGTNKYKIGKSKNILTRLRSPEYRNAFIYLVCYVNDESACERELIESFQEKYAQVREDTEGGFGSETFSGNVNEMMDLFYSICRKWR